MLLEGGQWIAIKLRILSLREFRQHDYWDEFGLIFPLLSPHGSGQNMQGDLRNGTGWLAFTTEMDRCKLERVLPFTIIENWVDSHYPGSAANGWIGLLRWGCQGLWKMPLCLCHVPVRPSLGSWKSKTHIPLDLWGLIYQPTPPRRNNKIKKNNSGYKTLFCIVLCWFCV